MYYDMITDEILLDSKRYKISDMVNAINRRYPNMNKSNFFHQLMDEVIDNTMSMDRNEQREEMVRLMCVAIKQDRESKKANNLYGRTEAAMLFLVAINLHPYYKAFVKN